MKLRNQLLTLSLATLLVPWSGWKLVQELEQFLRAGQESALLASARTVAQALPGEFQSSLLYARDQVLPLRSFAVRPIIDGYSDDWPEAESATTFTSDDGELELRVLAGQYQGQVYLYCRVSDLTRIRETPPSASPDAPQGRSDGIVLFLRNARGLVHFRVHTAAPGPLFLNSRTAGGGQLEGHWLERPDGYDLELALPPSPDPADISIGALDVRLGSAGQELVIEAGTLDNERPGRWLNAAAVMPRLHEWLGGVIPNGSRAWIVDTRSWVMADTGLIDGSGARESTWAERILYRVVASSRTELRGERPGQMVRFEEDLVHTALQGNDGQHWGQDPENAAVRNTVAVPIVLGQAVRGAVIMETSSDGLLLVTNRALGRLMLTTLLITVFLAAGLWFFATRLSRRVQRLSGAVSQAMDDAAHPSELPLTGDSDELGELARNNARLLRAVADYTSYLQKLAGRLSHELKTPLAITRSSLDNLASQPLDENAERYVSRAREGLDRQASIVRAMSEASRLEAAVRAAEWEKVDLASLFRSCVEAYRAVHKGRDIVLELPAGDIAWRCAPDLLVQALDKLVDNALSLTGASDRVTVGLQIEDGECRILVRNTGTRLPDVLHEQLFDSLVSLREKNTTGRHLGLGLHIVRLVAKAHRGRVSARNLSDDAGVEFMITLPSLA